MPLQRGCDDISFTAIFHDTNHSAYAQVSILLFHLFISMALTLVVENLYPRLYICCMKYNVKQISTHAIYTCINMYCMNSVQYRVNIMYIVYRFVSIGKVCSLCFFKNLISYN